MICQDCGNNNPGNNRFCGMCGALLAPGSGKTRATSEVKREESPTAKSEALHPPPPFVGHAQPRKDLERQAVQPSKPVQPVQPAKPVEPKKSAPAQPVRQRGVSGPSFLGLSEPAPIPQEDLYDADGKYYGDDLYKSNWSGRATLLLVVLLVLGGLGYLQWKSDHPLRSVLQASTPVGDSVSNSANTPAKDAESKKEDQIAASANQSPEQSQAVPAASASANDAAKKDEQLVKSTASNAVAVPPVVEEKKNKTLTEGANASASDSSEAAAKPADAGNSDAADATSAANSDGDATKTIDTQQPAETKAARANHEEQVKLAENYLEGKGVPQNCDEGLGILRAASNRGNTQAVIKLGALYATGSCVPLDRVTAYHYFSRAFEVQPRNSFLEHNRTMLWANMSDEERQRALAQDGDLSSH